MMIRKSPDLNQDNPQNIKIQFEIRQTEDSKRKPQLIINCSKCIKTSFLPQQKAQLHKMNKQLQNNKRKHLEVGTIYTICCLIKQKRGIIVKPKENQVLKRKLGIIKNCRKNFHHWKGI